MFNWQIGNYFGPDLLFYANSYTFVMLLVSKRHDAVMSKPESGESPGQYLLL